MKNRIKVYWLLLLVLLHTAGTVLSVGEAQARYVNTATWNTVVQPKETGVTSDCLEDLSGPKLNILLGTLPQEGRAFPFTITAGEAVSGKLNWTVDLPEYLSVQMHIGDSPITPENTIEIAAGETITVVMTLTPAEHTYTEVREALSAAIEVTWADSLRGTFLTQLPAVEEEEEPTEETEPETTEPSEPETTDPSEPETTAPPEPETTAPSEPETTAPSEPETTAPSEPETTDPSEPQVTNPSEPETTAPLEPVTEDPTQPSQSLSMIPQITLTRLCPPILPARMMGTTKKNNHVTTEPTYGDPNEPTPTEMEEIPLETVVSEDPAQQQEDPTVPQTVDSTEPSTAIEHPTEPSISTEDPTEHSEQAQEDTENLSEPIEDTAKQPPIILEASGSVNSAAALPIQITAPENSGPIRLGIVPQTEPEDSEGENQSVLENFQRYTRYSLDNGSSYYMLYHENTITLNPEQNEVLLDLSHTKLDNSQVILGAASQEEGEISTCAVTLIPDDDCLAEFPARILSVEQPLEIAIHDQGKEFALEYSLEMLTAIKSEDAETETIAYVPVELTGDTLRAELITGETGTKLVFSIGEKLPQAGTYRISLSWTYEETVCAQMQETIFINYSVYTESEQTGGAEQ